MCRVAQSRVRLTSPRGSEVPVPRCPAQQVPEVPGSGSATVAPNLCNGQVPGSGSSGRWRFQVPGEGKHAKIRRKIRKKPADSSIFRESCALANLQSDEHIDATFPTQTSHKGPPNERLKKTLQVPWIGSRFRFRTVGPRFPVVTAGSGSTTRFRGGSPGSRFRFHERARNPGGRRTS